MEVRHPELAFATLTQAAMAARAANENLSPLDLMLAIMRHPHAALVTRVKMALRALPLLHTKLKTVPSESSGLGHNGAAVPSSGAAKKSNSGHFAAMEQPEALAADIRAFFRSLRRE